MRLIALELYSRPLLLSNPAKAETSTCASIGAHVSLVYGLSPDDHRGQAHMALLVTVAVYHDLPGAMVARSCLEAYGLVAVLPEWYHSAVAWQLIFALHGLRLWTVDSTAEIAEELLHGAAPEHVAVIEEKQSGWLNADITIVDIVIAAVVVVMISLPLPLWKRRWAKPRGAE